MRRKQVLKGLLVISLLLIGYLVGKFTNIPGLRVSKEIDLSEIAAIVTTVVVGTFLLIWFDKSKEENRLEKEWILASVQELENDRRNFFRSIASQGKPIRYTFLTSSNKKLGKLVDDLLSDLDVSNLRSIHQTYQEKLWGILDGIHKTTTEADNIPDDTNVIRYGNEPQVTIANNRLTFSETRMRHIESEFNKLRRALLELKRSINRHY